MKYCADTGLGFYEFDADSDFEACAEYPDAMIWRKDGKEMDAKECHAGFEGMEFQY